MKFNVPYGEKISCNVEFMEPSMTHQCFKDECDINVLMSKWQKVPELFPEVDAFRKRYEDVSEFVSYQDALTQVRDAQDLFLTLPAQIRDMFKNDPGLFLDFAMNPENEAAMREMGLMAPVEETGKQPEVVVSNDVNNEVKN